MPNSQICVDASLAIKLVSPEPGRDQVLVLWEGWLKEGAILVAPYLFCYEVTSVLWRKAVRGIWTHEEARAAVEAALDLGVRLMDAPGLSLQAFDIAARFRRPAAYDAHYLALAEVLGCNFWTADRKLYNAVQEQLSYVHCLET